MMSVSGLCTSGRLNLATCTMQLEGRYAPHGIRKIPHGMWAMLNPTNARAYVCRVEFNAYEMDDVAEFQPFPRPRLYQRNSARKKRTRNHLLSIASEIDRAGLRRNHGVSRATRSIPDMAEITDEFPPFTTNSCWRSKKRGGT